MDYWHWLVVILVAYLLLAYFLVPRLWRRYERRHPALADAPRITHTANGIHGEPLNVAHVEGADQLHTALVAAGWLPADPITLACGLALRRSRCAEPRILSTHVGGTSHVVH